MAPFLVGLGLVIYFFILGPPGLDHFGSLSFIFLPFSSTASHRRLTRLVNGQLLLLDVPLLQSLQVVLLLPHRFHLLLQGRFIRRHLVHEVTRRVVDQSLLDALLLGEHPRFLLLDLRVVVFLALHFFFYARVDDLIFNSCLEPQLLELLVRELVFIAFELLLDGLFLSGAHVLLEVARHFLLDELAVALFNPQSLEIILAELR
mmetsp:Transcript_8925/g.23223  ORF Transcript_8925/g.23223 Transcript_8925/m.23223 type:complete len:204 (-) Transcript_8925:694-1305(-)